jgi:phage terminase large subunit-like protein
VTIFESFLQAECRRAQAIPSFVPLFCRRYLNVWLTNQARWIDIEAWDRCARPPAEIEAVHGRSCIVGLDLSTTNDLSAVVAVFPDSETGYTILPFAFCPNEAIATRSRRDRVDYAKWRDEGAIITSAGNIVDQNQILQKILEIKDEYSLVELAYDRWNASMLVSCLRANRLTCVPVPQTISFLNIAARELESAISRGRLVHFGHPVLKWCVTNAVIEMNSAGEIKPAKNKSHERIDLLLAMMFALARICVRRR